MATQEILIGVMLAAVIAMFAAMMTTLVGMVRRDRPAAKSNVDELVRKQLNLAQQVVKLQAQLVRQMAQLQTRVERLETTS